MIVFGLGNPGAKYRGTRHNVGFDTVERIAAQKEIKFRKRCFRLYKRAVSDSLVLIEPLTYMNASGDIAKECITPGDTVVVVVDQMDLPPGKIRIKRGGSSAGHNGLKSMIGAIGPDFIRLYIGIGRPDAGVSVPDHVLSRPNAVDRSLIDEAEAKASDAILRLYGGESFERIAQSINS